MVAEPLRARPSYQTRNHPWLADLAPQARREDAIRTDWMFSVMFVCDNHADPPRRHSGASSRAAVEQTIR
jgi:hypothetical protein